jgi:hypothetical protein
MCAERNRAGRIKLSVFAIGTELLYQCRWLYAVGRHLLCVCDVTQVTSTKILFEACVSVGLHTSPYMRFIADTTSLMYQISSIYNVKYQLSSVQTDNQFDSLSIIDYRLLPIKITSKTNDIVSQLFIACGIYSPRRLYIPTAGREALTSTHSFVVFLFLLLAETSEKVNR